MIPPSLQFPGLLCFGTGFFSLIEARNLSVLSLLGATLIVESSSLAETVGLRSALSMGLQGCAMSDITFTAGSLCHDVAGS
jgi:hypothetical protein